MKNKYCKIASTLCRSVKSPQLRVNVKHEKDGNIVFSSKSRFLNADISPLLSKYCRPVSSPFSNIKESRSTLNNTQTDRMKILNFKRRDNQTIKSQNGRVADQMKSYNPLNSPQQSHTFSDLLNQNNLNVNDVRASFISLGPNQTKVEVILSPQMKSLTSKTPRGIFKDFDKEKEKVFSACGKRKQLNWTNVDPKSAMISPIQRNGVSRRRDRFKTVKNGQVNSIPESNRGKIEHLYSLKSHDSLVNNLKLEIRQLKALNKKLIDQKLDLEEKLNLETKNKRFEEMLTKDNNTNKNKIVSMIEKNNKTYIMSKLMIYVKDLRKEHDKEINDLKVSFTEQIEELQETISILSKNLTQTYELKQYHGQKLVSIIDKTKQKYDNLKTENKKVSATIDKYKSEYGKLQFEQTETIKNLMKSQALCDEYSKKIEQLEKINYNFRKMLGFDSNCAPINISILRKR